MNWDAIAAVGELLGASAVLVTLIYLAVQIRQNTSAVATATYESTMTGFNDINIVVAGGRVEHLPKEAAQFLEQPGCRITSAQIQAADQYRAHRLLAGQQYSAFGFH